MNGLRFHRRRLRHTVWVTLLAWLFALAASVVNACVLTSQRETGNIVSAVTPLRSATPAGHTGAWGDAQPGDHDDPATRQGHERDAGKGACLKFCDDESSALSKSKGSALDPGVPLLAAIASRSPIVPSAALATALSLGRSCAQGPPTLVIRFLRLTL